MIVGYTYGFMCPSRKADEIREEKLKLLRDFCITPTESEKEILSGLSTEREMDAFVKDMIRIHLN